MLRYLTFVFLLSSFFSCKTNYGLFQSTGSMVPHTSKLEKGLSSIKTLKPKTETKKLTVAQPKVQKVEFSSRGSNIPIIIPPEDEEHLRVLEKTSFESPDESLFNPKPKKKKKKKNNRKFRQVSSNLFIGITFLAIAVLMGLLNIPALVGLFGLASIIFLTLGLKKLWKKKRRRNRFKDIFNSKE